MAFERARSGETRVVFWLEIDGFAQVYHTGPAPTVGAGRVAVPSLVSVGGTTARVDLMSSAFQPSTCAVTIARLPDYPLTDLLRAAPNGADRFVTLATTVEQGTAGVFSVVANEDISAFAATGSIWIGQECMLYASKNDATKTFTVNGVGRGYLGSVVMQHVANTAEGWAPRIYSNCVSWRHRRARVWCDELLPNGTLAGPPYCHIDGWLRSEPEQATSSTYTIQIESVAAQTDREIGGESAATGLQLGHHAFDGITHDKLNTLRYSIKQGSIVFELASVNTPVGTAEVRGVDNSNHQAVFDVSSTDGRRGDLLYIPGGGAGSERLRPIGYVGASTFTLQSGIPSAIPVGGRVANAEASYHPSPSAITTPGTPEIVGWPAVAMDRVFGALQPAVGTMTQWVSPEFVDGENGPAVYFMSLFDVSFFFAPVVVTFGQPDQDTLVGFCVGEDLPALAIRRGDPDWHKRTTAVPFVAALGGGDDAGSMDGQIAIGGIPIAWHANAEKYLYVAEDVFSTPTVNDPIQVEVVHQYKDEEKRSVYTIVDKIAAATITAGAPGWLLVKDDPCRLDAEPLDRNYPIADWLGQPSATIRQIVAWAGASPTLMMLELLLSSHGNGHNHPTYDRLPYGCNLEPVQVDIDSFVRFPLPPTAARRWWRIDDQHNVADLLADLAQSIGAIYVERLSRISGRRRIALASAGAPIRRLAATTIGSGDWAVMSAPKPSRDDNLVNSCGFSLNYAEGEAKLTVTINNRDGIQEHGSTEREEIRLYGVRINAQSPNSQRAEVLPIAARRFAQFGSPRIIISGGVSYSDSLLIDPGATIVFSAATADDFDGTRGLSSVVGVVRSISRNPTEQRSKVEIVYTGRNGAGWSPSMLATAAPAATKLTVEANEYSPTRHEITGETMTDASFFAVGDPVDVVPTGNYAARVSTVITAIVGSTITLAGAHGLAAPDWGTIRPQYYDLTSDALRQYVFGADDNGTLGAASITAYVYL